MEVLNAIAQQLQLGEDEQVRMLTQQAIAQGVDPKLILDDGLIAGMNAVGVSFRNHEIFLPDVLMAAKAMYAGMDLLKPLFVKGGIPSRGTVVLGTVKGDLHDLGKNLVGIMLKGVGYKVVDLGKDVAPEAFVDAAARTGAKVIGMSALLTTTMPAMKSVIELLHARGLHGQVRTIVGGAPVTRAYAEQIGADAYAFDAAKSVECVNAMLGA